MVRVADQQRPAELLEAIVRYLVQHGIAGLSLRPLAKAVDSSPRVLLYYFGSKEKLLACAIQRLRERQRLGFDKLRQVHYENPSDACRAIWQQMCGPESLAWFRLSLETYTMALRQPRQFADFLSTSVEDWLEFLSQPLIAKGASPAGARQFATVVVAGFRGFLLDYYASRDRKRVHGAVEMWLATLDTISPALPAGKTEN